MTRLDAIVVGAGPAGSVAGAALAARGYRTVVLDRARFPRDKPCGDYCDPGAVRLLETLGLLPRLIAEGAALIGGMTVVAQDGTGFSAAYPTGRGMLIPRRRLDAVLAERAAAAGAEVVEGFQVDHVRVDGEVTIASVGRRLPVRGALLVAADGMRSVVARRLGLLTALPAGRYTVGAYYSGVMGDPAGELHLGNGLYGGVARFGDGTANVCLALPRSWLRARGADAAFESAVRTLPGLQDAMTGWRRETSLRVTGPIGFAGRRAAADRVLLAGDAALQIEPLTGQGMFFAFQSALLAAEAAAGALDRGVFTSRALAGYAHRRSRLLGGKLRLLRLVTALALRPRITPRLVRRLIADARLAQTLLGATGDVLPPGAMLTVPNLLRLLAASHAHDA